MADNLITDHAYESGPQNTHGPCIAAGKHGVVCGWPEKDHETSEYVSPTRQQFDKFVQRRLMNYHGHSYDHASGWIRAHGDYMNSMWESGLPPQETAGYIADMIKIEDERLGTVPNMVPRDEQEKFVAADVRTFIHDLEAPLFNYRMARGQLSRRGMPRRLRRYEEDIRRLVRAHTLLLLDVNDQREDPK